MGRYSAQFRNNVVRKLLPPQSKTVGEVAAEFGISKATIYGWKAKMNDGTARSLSRLRPMHCHAPVREAVRIAAESERIRPMFEMMIVRRADDGSFCICE